jgi:hypothetical protein
MADVDQQFVDAKTAYNQLGIYGGDDGLTADPNMSLYTNTADLFHQVLKVEKVQRDENGVSFLARKYSYLVWQGCTDSMIDVRRQLSKFHVTANLPSNITPIHKLIEKARSFYYSDKETPIIGELCAKIYDLSKDMLLPNNITCMRRWDYEECFEKQYPNSNVQGWMLPEIIKQFEPNSFDLLTFKKWIKEGIQTLKDIISCPSFAVIQDLKITQNSDVITANNIYPANLSLDSKQANATKDAHSKRNDNHNVPVSKMTKINSNFDHTAKIINDIADNKVHVTDMAMKLSFPSVEIQKKTNMFKQINQIATNKTRVSKPVLYGPPGPPFISRTGPYKNGTRQFNPSKKFTGKPKYRSRGSAVKLTPIKT